MNNKLIQNKILLFCIGMCILLIILFCFMFNWGLLFGDDCYTNRGILHNQYVGKLEGCCDNCLILNVSEQECSCYGENGCHLWLPEDKINKTLYFSDENRLLNISNGESINIRWCWINGIKDYRIRGITNE